MPVGHPIWLDQLTEAELAVLEPGIPDELDRAPDVLVVGGGILGCATAAACVRAALGSVVLLERERLGSGASGGATGLLRPEAHVATDPQPLVNLARLSLEGWRDLEATWPQGVGLIRTDWHGHIQARVNPWRAVAHLAAWLPSVATGVNVTNVSIVDSRIDTVGTSHGEFRPRSVVFATGNPPQLDGLAIDIPWLEVKGHMLATAPTSLRPPSSSEDIVTQIEDGRLVMGGTIDLDDHERVVRPEATAGLWNDLIEAWPAARDIPIEYRWACFRPAHPDRLAVIDRVPGVSNAWLTSGHYKTGILLAAATGRALAEWIISGSPPPEVLPFALSRLAASR